MENDLFSEIRKARVENPKLPCKTCGGDCCGATTPFEMEDIKRIEKNYPKLTKKMRAIKPPKLPAYNIRKKGHPNPDKCVFFDSKIGCKIYDCRPQICRDFGERVYSPCPFNGLDKIPNTREEQEVYVIKSQKASFDYMKSFVPIEVASKVNIHHYSIKNVVANN